MRRRRSQTLLVLLLFIVGGAIINVAVAWGGSLAWTRMRLSGVHEEDASGGHFTASDEWLGFAQIDSLLFTELNWSAGLPEQSLEMSRNARVPHAPWWSIVPSLPGYQRPGVDGHRPSLKHDEVGCGFPMVSMVWCGQWRMWELVPFTPVIRLREQPFNNSYSQGTVLRVLPMLLAWPGFAINTIFYAAILWLLFTAPGFVRRRIRIKRGLCPACAYPTGSSDVCTECGAAVRIQKP